MLKKILLSLIFICYVSVVLAGLPSVTAVKTAKKPVINGKISEDCWNNAEWQTGFLKLDTRQKASPQTKFKILYDDLGIYLAVSCDDSDIKTKARLKDAMPAVDDCIEIFIVPQSTVSADPNIRELYHFIVNASGSQFDRFINGGVGDSNWNTRWKAATTMRTGGWDVEVFLPFSCFNIQTNDTTWRFNLARENKGKKRENSTWSLLGNFVDSSMYGELKGLEADFNRYKLSVSSLRIKNKPVNKKVIPVLLATVNGAVAKGFSAKCAVYKDKKLVNFSSATVNIIEQGRLKLEVPLGKITQSGEYLINLILSDSKGVVYYSEVVKNISTAPIRVSVIKPFYRNNIYSKQANKTVLIEYHLALSSDEMQQYQLIIKLKNSAGKTIKKQEIAIPQPVNRFEFDAAGLTVDKYEVVATLVKGKAAVCSFSEFINVLPPSKGNEIWLNPERQVVINGKVFFPNGFMGVDHKGLLILGDSGFNLIHSYVLHYASIDNIIKMLDNAEKYGLKMIFAPYHRLRHGFHGWGSNARYKTKLTAEQTEKMLKMVNRVKNHPAFFGWYLYDEARGAEHCQELERIYHILRATDPFHPVIGLDNTAGGCINKYGYCDIHSLDLYPSPRKKAGNNIPISVLYNNVEKMHKELGREGVWYTPQAFSRESFAPKGSNHRPPTYREIRCSVYSAIVAGATGLMPYKIGTPSVKYRQRHSNSGIFYSPDMKIGFLNGMGPEINCMSNVLLSETLSGQVSSSNPKVKLLVKRYHGNIFVIAVNLTPDNIGKSKIKLLSVKSNKMKVLFENRKLRVVDNNITDAFPAFAVHIYTDALNFKEPLNINEIQNRINEKNGDL